MQFLLQRKVQKEWLRKILVFLLVASYSCNGYSAVLANNLNSVFDYKAEPAESEKDTLKVVDAYVSAGRFQKAASILENVRNAHKSKCLFLELAYCLFASGDGGALVATCDRWLASNYQDSPEFEALVYALKALGFELQRKYPEARDSYTKSIEVDSKERTITSRESVIAAIEGRADLKGSLPSTWRVRIGRSLIINSNFVFVETPLDLSKVFKRPKLCELLSAASASETSGNFEEAAKYYDEASKLPGFDSSMLNQYALCLLTWLVFVADQNRGERERAGNANADDSVAERTKRMLSFLDLGINDLEKNERKLGLAMFRKIDHLLKQAVRKDYGDWRLWSNLAMIQIKEHDDRGYAESFKKATKSNQMPGNTRMFLLSFAHLGKSTDGFDKIRKRSSKRKSHGIMP